jgi:hypothetical protein
MFFIYDRDNPKELIFYVIVILFGIVLEYYEIADIEKVIGIGIFAVIVRYVFKSLIFGTCSKGCNKDV